MLVPKLRFKRDDETIYPDWEEKTLSDICETILGGGTPTTENKNYWNGNIAWVSSSDLKNNNIHQLSITRFITKEAINVSATKLIPRNSVLIVSRVGVGKVVVAPCELCTSQDFTNIVNPKCNSMFLGYLLSVTMQHKANGVQGTSIKGITAKEIKQYKLYIPHNEEQQKIADFLSTVDEIITQSENEVKNLEQQKKTTMQKIFSQEVRFKREDGTAFPEWEFDSLKNLCDYTDYRGKTPAKTESGIFLVTAKNIKQGYIDYETSKEYIAEADYETVMQRGFPQIGDVLITTEAPCGNIAQIDREKVALAQRVIKYRGKKERLSNDYLCFALQSELFQDELDKRATGGTVKGIKGSVLHTLSIYVPCLEEQQKIADFLSAYDEAITYAKQELEKWKELKKGLLQQMFV